jgi:heme exporter protein D
MNKKKFIWLGVIIFILLLPVFSVLQRVSEQKAYEQNEIEKEKKAQQASIERAKNQGTSGLGRSSWGTF